MPSHGALSKAGKGRGNCPKKFSERKSKKGTSLGHKRKHKSPRVSNRKKYKRAIILGQERTNKNEGSERW